MTFQSVSDNDLLDVNLPSMQGTTEDDGLSSVHPSINSLTDYIAVALDAFSALKVQDTPADVFSTPPQLDGELITLTLLPRARWQTLLNLEVIHVRFLPCLLKCTLTSFPIQQRNKPKDPPKAPEQAPFFLPTLPGVEHRFAPPTTKAAEPKKSSKRLENNAASVESVFYRKLVTEARDGDCEFHFQN